MTDRRRPNMARQGPQARRIEPEGPRLGARGPRIEPGGPRIEPDGPRLGPLPISPTGILLVVALIGSLLYLLYALTNRDVSQIPLLASGAVVLGLVFVAVAATGLIATWRSSVRGRDGRALVHAIVGGMACLAAAGCFAVAIILGMVGAS